MIKDIDSQIAKLEELNLKADLQFTSQLKQLKHCGKSEMAELKMGFDLVKADLQLSASESHEVELQKLLLTENLRGLLENVNGQGDIDVKIKSLLSDIGNLQAAADEGFDKFMSVLLK